MSHCGSSRDESLSPAQVLLITLFFVGFLYLAYLIARWVIETREGKLFAAVAGVVLGVLWLAGAFADPAARPATAEPVRAVQAPAPHASPVEIFVSDPGRQQSAWMTVHGSAPVQNAVRRVGGAEICTIHAGQTRCTSGPR